VEDAVPVGIVETSNRVPENAEGANSGAGSVSHDGHVMCPIEPMVNEDTKVADDGGPLNSVGTGAGCLGVDRRDEAADETFSGTRGGKRDELSLICVTL